MSDAKLRAKTGFLTCRQRKVKCGEEKPSCQNCSRFGRNCLWPQAADMADRRHRPRRVTSVPQLFPDERCFSPNANEISHQLIHNIHNGPLSSTSNHPFFETNIEFQLIHHFYNFQFSSITLPTNDQEYFYQCQSDLMDMMLQSKAVKYAVLANCASNKHVLLNIGRYRVIALHYYTQAMRCLNQELVDFCASDTYRHSCLLTVAPYLYIYNFWSIDAMSNPRPHVVGAVKLLSLRKKKNSASVSLTQSYDRINIESVLYQGFLLSIRRPFRPDFRLDSQFISHAEDLLRFYDDLNPSCTKPSIVLGVPTSLYQIKLRILDSYNVSPSRLQDHLEALKVELQYWEQSLLNEDRSPTENSPFSDLIILATSLLLDLVKETLLSQSSNVSTLWLSPSIETEDPKPWRWQMDLAISILQCPNEHEKWSGCYLGAWPLLILGYGARSLEEITLIKNILREMQQRIGYGEVQRIREELDEITVFEI